MAMTTASNRGGIISIETGVKMKAASRRLNEKPRELHCDNCGWRVFVQEERTTKKGKVVPAFFQHYPGHPFCSYSGAPYELMRSFAHLRPTQTRRDHFNNLLLSLTELYQIGSQMVEYCGESIQEIKVKMPELRGWRQKQLFALEEPGTASAEFFDETSPQQLIARQSAILRMGVFHLLSSLHQSEGPLSMAQVAQEIETFQPVVDRTSRLVAAVELAYPSIASTRQPHLADFLTPGRRDLSSYSETLINIGKFYLEHQSNERGSSLRPYEARYLEEIHKQLRECSEGLLRTEERERVQAAQTVRRIEKKLEDLMGMIPLMPEGGWDVEYFVGVSGYVAGTVSIKLAAFEKAKGCKFDLGPSGRKFTKNSILAAGFKEWLGKKGGREEA